MDLTPRIKIIRQQAGLTQSQLANACGLDQTALSRYERGERNIPLETAFALAEYFECSVEYLMGRDRENGNDGDGHHNRSAAGRVMAWATGAEACKRCGRRNPSWSAPSPLWNAVMRGGSVDGPPEYGDMVCATCFMVLAEEKGIACGFRVVADVVHVELETVTPSGRAWDTESGMWLGPGDAA